FYYLAHGVVLAMFFSPALVFSTRLVTRSLVAKIRLDAGQQRTIILVTFVGFCAASIFAMIAVFTEAVGTLAEFERYRIHGRYWTFLMPWLALITFGSFVSIERVKESVWVSRAAGLIGLAATLLFVFVISPHFSLYPWDFPELFGFYRQEMQTWKMPLL